MSAVCCKSLVLRWGVDGGISEAKSAMNHWSLQLSDGREKETTAVSHTGKES